MHDEFSSLKEKIIDFCMDLQPCFKSHNLIPVQLQSTKFGQITNLNITFYMAVSVYWLVYIWNSPQFPTQLQNGQ